MKLIVGLGNPGKPYVGTRHNMGYIALDKFAEMAGGDFDRSMFKGVYGIVKNPAFSEPIIIAKPETFMNLSGEFVSPVLQYFKIPIEDLVVVYDDMSIPEGAIRLRLDGSSGGHNGMQNIIDQLGTSQIKRIRIGIGEPPFSGVDWVLTKPDKESQPKLDESTTNAARAIRDMLLHDFTYAMNHYNGGVI